ncbi:MAG: hypothetical protein WB711_17990 [Terriglobales bacterium]
MHLPSLTVPGTSRLLVGMVALIAIGGIAPAQTDPFASKSLIDHNPRLSDFQVIEFRRYVIKDGKRPAFIQYFDTYFPEAFQQLGTIIAGSLSERQNPSGFVWIRGFHTIDDRAVLNGIFYYGSVWDEHRKTMNDLIDNSDNVMLLRPLSPEREIPILPAVDPVAEPNGAQGIVVAEIFAVKPNSVEDFARQAKTAFASYRSAGAREAGVLVTLDVKNNFPQLPYRTDGPFLIWLGILRDNEMLNSAFNLAMKESEKMFTASGLLRSPPELIVLDPTPRSRLRWLP